MEIENLCEKPFQVCVVGGGPAGIIVALECASQNPDRLVVLIEYGNGPGSNGKNDLDDSIVINNLVNHHHPYECTNKGLGGTSTTWGGRCVMYDPVDFIERGVVAGNCTWDMELFRELQEFLPRTSEYFECGESNFNLERTKFKGQRIAENFVEGIVTDSIMERWSMPTRFGKRFRKQIEAQRNLILLEGFEARDFVLSTNHGEVTGLTIREIGTGKVGTVNAKKFVLAAGTQETTRILLRNPQLFKLLGGPPDALGKYYQSHVSGKIASVKFNGNPKKTDFGFLRDEDGTYLRRRFQFTTDFLVKQNLLNTAIWLDNPLYYDPCHRSGAMSFMYLAMITPFLGNRLAPPAIAQSVTKGKVYRIRQHIWNILSGLPNSVLIPAAVFFKRYCQKRKLPGVFLFSPENIYALHFHSEQIPCVENRMELESDNETLKIYYDLTDADVVSVVKLHEALDSSLRASGCGKLEYWFPQEELPANIRLMSRDGIHQSGTTRIASSSKEGVVDRNLKVFGTNNVYVCSSSVFPTSSQANPTYFLGAFGVRLAKHLNELS